MTGPRLVTCHQPVYLPWPGFFHKLVLADVFVVMDTVNFSRRGNQSRNRIMTADGRPHWVTVPLALKASPSRRLRDVRIASQDGVRDAEHAGMSVPKWQRDHWNSLRLSYGRAPYWSRYAAELEELYLGRTWTKLMDLNTALLRLLVAWLKIDVEFVLASELGSTGAKSDLVLDQCLRSAASLYVSGTHGKDYLQEEHFLENGISIFYQSYRLPETGAPCSATPQALSVIDLLFRRGVAAKDALSDGNITRSDIVDALHGAGAPTVLETHATRASTRQSVRVRGPHALLGEPAPEARPLGDGHA
ncbi:WbqC family protein [Streptomyces sp. CB01201]|uniref:WbqC family protein n=1 Tax=Streptomyces sp. CB01201 TaxID=2020324 RepID=UPI00131BC3C5|nr:WbqC family protein [Streptomyces sp. CB01201]